MPVTAEDLRHILGAEEPDYRAAARLGPSVLPLLMEMARNNEPDAGLAAKAISLASLIDNDVAAEIIGEASSSADPIIRVAAAISIGNLSRPPLDVAARLLGDADAGIRKSTLRSIGRTGAGSDPALAAQPKKIAASDSQVTLRTAAGELLGDR